MTNRRTFIKRTSLSGMAALLGTNVVFGANLPSGIKLLGLQDPYELFGKNKDMIVLNSKPWNLESQPHILNDAVTPASNMFIRNNGIIPKEINLEEWSLTIEGESISEKKTFSLSELKEKFKKYSYQLALECGGNGRSEFNPPAKGNQWTLGAVSNAQWSGLRLRDLLKEVGISDAAVYVGYEGADIHLSGDRTKRPISRGIPISKAMMDETLLAYEMNGEPIPLAHGLPLRLVAGGWPASASGKWLTKLLIRDKVHDGAKMGGSSYRVPCESVAPGTKVAEEDMCIIESMPVKSLTTYPKTGAIISAGESLSINGQAWAGELAVSSMEYSIDFGASWKNCELKDPANRLAWQQWKAEVTFPGKGYYEIWAKATDSEGRSQPMVLPGWNPKGYLNNACHRIAVMVS